MKRRYFRWMATCGLAAFALVAASGCTGDASTITFLDVVDTILLAITAAGGIVLIKNV